MIVKKWEEFSLTENYFVEDMTKVKDKNVYKGSDFKDAADRIQRRGISVKPGPDKRSIHIEHKKDGHYMVFSYEDGYWTGSFEDGLTPAGDSAIMSLDEFVDEVNDWSEWYQSYRKKQKH